MGIFYNYNNAGPGIAKDGPKKKPFFRYLELLGRKIWKLIGLNLVYFLCCIPIITIGPATAALTHVMRKFVLEQPCFIYSEFFDAFKKNFVQSIGLGIFDAIYIATIIYAAIIYSNSTNDDSTLILAVTFGASALVLMIHFYLYLEIVALKLKIGSIIKNGMLLAVLGIKRNILMLFICVLIITAFVLLFPYSLAILPVFPFAFLSFTITFICYPVIQKTIINPYYESRGERNPELGELAENTASKDETVFTDQGGHEAPIKGKKIKGSGKVIR